jgi:glycosyltransferase involved in cell wall biosynthesis
MLSVVMITYKHELFIHKAIEGVLTQITNFDFELIIADDCSPDNTFQIVNELIANNNNRFCKVKYTRHEKNKGMMENFIWALSQSKSKYIALCEGDDYWIDNLKLQKQIELLEGDSKLSLSFHQAKKINEADQSSIIYPELKQNIFNSNNFFDIVTIPMASVLFRNNFSYPILKNHSHPDFILLCCLLSNGAAHYTDVVMSVYRVHEGGITFNQFNSSCLKIRIRELKIEAKLKVLDQIVSKEVGHLYVKHVLILLDNFDSEITTIEKIFYLFNCFIIPKRNCSYFLVYKKIVKNCIKNLFKTTSRKKFNPDF